jgi:hypothetical protein
MATRTEELEQILRVPRGSFVPLIDRSSAGCRTRLRAKWRMAAVFLAPRQARGATDPY